VDIERMMSLYGKHVDTLVQKNFITLDDAQVYKQVFPIFEPMFVFYDEQNAEYYGRLDSMYR
jgi:hypothetical protein